MIGGASALRLCCPLPLAPLRAPLSVLSDARLRLMMAEMTAEQSEEWQGEGGDGGAEGNAGGVGGGGGDGGEGGDCGEGGEGQAEWVGRLRGEVMNDRRRVSFLLMSHITATWCNGEGGGGVGGGAMVGGNGTGTGFGAGKKTNGKMKDMKAKANAKANAHAQAKGKGKGNTKKKRQRSSLQGSAEGEEVAPDPLPLTPLTPLQVRRPRYTITFSVEK